MAGPLNPECQQLLKLLEDMEWHFVDEILLKLIGQVAPGRAIRRYDLSARIREEKFGPRVGPELSDAQKIQSGARTLANHAINSMRKRYIEVDDNGDVRLCRARPTPLPVRTRNIPREPRSTDKVDQAAREAALAAKRAEAAARQAEVPQADSEPAMAPQKAPEPQKVPETSVELECGVCGLYVVSPDSHALWHKRRDEEATAQVEEIVRRVMGEEMAMLRRGLQGFMMGRFAALEVVLGERLPTRNRW
jgi:hypothetical protein